MTNERHGTDISKGNAIGDESIAAKEHGFNLREALGADLAWICAEADAVAMLPGWETSRGATAERATAIALGLECGQLVVNGCGKPWRGEYSKMREDHDALKDLSARARDHSSPVAEPPRRLLPADPKARKEYPIGEGVLDYFPDALAAVANVSYVGNQQHNPGQPTHWARVNPWITLTAYLRHLITWYAGHGQAAPYGQVGVACTCAVAGGT